MTQETALTLAETMSLGTVLARSGYFSDAKGEAQAVVKVLAGRELGFGPIASMTGVHIVQGKPALGANLLAAAIKGSGKYDYRVIGELTNERCEIAFFQGNQEIGRSVFTIEDAQAAGLTNNPTWKKFPRNMLFSRAMSNGARWFCPDVFSGVTPYTPEELGAEVDGNGEVVDVTPIAVAEPEPELQPDSADGLPSDGQPTNHTQLFDALQPLGYYNHGKHMLNTLNKIKGTNYNGWPVGENPDFYGEALELLTAYAQENQEQQEMDL